MHSSTVLVEESLRNVVVVVTCCCTCYGDLKFGALYSKLRVQVEIVAVISSNHKAMDR